MGSGYVIIEMDKLDKFPEYDRARTRLLTETVDWTAKKVWNGMTFGEMFPDEGQFGITSILPNVAFGIPTFRQSLSGPGWANIFNLTTPEDIVLGVIGFAFPDSSMNITEIRAEIGKTKYPRINLEEARAYRQPAVLFKQGSAVEEEKKFLVRGYVEASGFQRVVPLGFMLYKKPDLVISE